MKHVSLKKNAILNIIYKLSSLVFPLIVYPYVSRIIQATNMGTVSFYSSLTSYMVMLGSLGITTYGIRTVAKVRDDNRELSIVTKELVIINTVATALALGALVVLVFFAPKFRQDVVLLAISCVQIVMAPFGMEWLYSGLEQYEYITKRAIFVKVISLVLIFLFVREKEDYMVYAAITVFAYVGNYVFNLVHSRKFVDFHVKAKWQFKRHIKSVFVLFASIMAINIYTNVDTIMLGLINGNRAVGLYDVACKGKWVLLYLVNAISTVLFPRLSYYLSEKDYKSYNNVLKKSITTIMCIAIPLTLFFMLEAEYVVLFLGGEDYVDAILCMQILMPILVISGFSNITGNQILLPHGKEVAYLRAVVTGAVVDIFLNVLLMPKYSLYGAAIATLMAELAQMLMQLYQSREYLNGNFDGKEVIKIGIASVVSVGVVFAFGKVFEGSGLVNLMVHFGVFIIIYFMMALLFRVKIFVKVLKDLLLLL